MSLGTLLLGTVVGAIAAIAGLVSWAFWSHKVLRWFCPALLIIALVSNFWLADTLMYRALLLSQGAFYGLAILGSLSFSTSLPGKIAKAAWMFVNMNLGLGFGFFRWLFKTQKGTWKRTERSDSEAGLKSSDTDAVHVKRLSKAH